MWGASSPGALAGRFAKLVEELGGDTAAAKTRARQRALLQAISDKCPAMLNDVAAAVNRGPPAVSRAVDVLVRSGLVVREADPHNRRRLQLSLTEAGEMELDQPVAGDSGLEGRLGRLASSELRALERGIEILERLPQ